MNTLTNIETVPMQSNSDGMKLANLFAENDLIPGLMKEIEELSEENSRLRIALSRVASNLGNGSVAAAEASIEFLEEIPREVKLVCDRLRQEALTNRNNIHPVCKT
jgi:hypothetical protein